MVAKKREEKVEKKTTTVQHEVESDTTQKESVAKVETKVDVKVGPTVAKRGARKESEEIDPGEQIESAIGRTERFIYENGKKLLILLAVLVLVASGILAYKHLHLTGRSEKANAAMYVAQQQFNSNDFETALNGDGNNFGFLEVIKKYGSSKEGNLAQHYAGICYHKLGDIDKALEHLSKYKTTKGVPNEIINVQNQGLQGDLYVQKGEYDKAVAKYKKAVELSENPLTTPLYLKKKALVYDKLGRHKEAIIALQRIKDQFPNSIEARDAEKFIGEQEQK